MADFRTEMGNTWDEPEAPCCSRMKKRKKTRSRAGSGRAATKMSAMAWVYTKGILKEYKCQLKILIDNWKYLYNKINETILGYKQTIKATLSTSNWLNKQLSV